MILVKMGSEEDRNERKIKLGYRTDGERLMFIYVKQRQRCDKAEVGIFFFFTLLLGSKTAINITHGDKTIMVEAQDRIVPQKYYAGCFENNGSKRTNSVFDVPLYRILLGLL